MPERSRSPQGPRHVAPGGEWHPWWCALDGRRLLVAVGATLLALPLLVLDNLPESTRGTAEAVETVATPTSDEPTTSSSSSSSTVTTEEPTTTAPPTTAAPTTAPPTTAPPTTRPAPATTSPPTTASPPAAPAGSIEEIIHAHFGSAGAEAVAVARCESDLDPSAIGGGGRYFGLFQIGLSHAAAFERVTGRTFDSAWSDPNANTQYARWLYDQSGWSAWGCRDEI